MKLMKNNKISAIAKLINMQRGVGFFLMMCIAYTIVYQSSHSTLFYIFLFWQAIAWAPIAYVFVVYSKSQRAAENYLQVVDSIFFGIWIAICHFNPWFTVVIVTASVMGNIFLQGIKLSSIYFLFCFIAAATYGYFDHYEIALQTSLTTMVSAAAGFFIYCFYIAMSVNKYSVAALAAAKELNKANEEITQLNKITQAASSNIDLNTAMETVISILRDVIDFDTMAIQLADMTKKKLDFFAIYGRYITQRYLNDIAAVNVFFEKNESMTSDVYNTQKLIYLEKVEKNNLLPKDKELFEVKQYLSTLIIPIIIQNKSVGVISFLSHYKYLSINDIQIEKFYKFVSQISTVIYNSLLFQKIEQTINEKLEEKSSLKKCLSNFHPFFMPEVFETVTNVESPVMLPIYHKRITILCMAISNFYKLTDSLEAEDYINILNDFYSEVLKLVTQFKGIIITSENDLYSIVFGCNANATNVKSDAISCANFACAIQKKIPVMNAKWLEQGLPANLELSIAINSGISSIGYIGNELYKEYTAMSDNYTLTKQLLKKASANQIVISHGTFLLIQESFTCQFIEKVSFPRINQSVLTYSLNGLSNIH
ncbi:MAG: adenylate/guanylate cyclase domain-containing protein [Gammaproteobacteria bacterium]